MASYAAGFLVAVATFLVLPLQAQAQTVQTLVSNTGQSESSNLNVGTSGSVQWSIALGFTTGDNTGGYTLSSVEVGIKQDFDGSDEARVSIYGADASGNPESSLHVLDNPASITNGELNTFTTSAYPYLIKETKYFVVVESVAAGQRFVLSATFSDDEDAGKANGWSIADRRHTRDSDAGSWEESTFTTKPRIAVKGTISGPRVPVTIEAEHESIGGGLEDLKFTLTREGETTDELDVTVTIVQDESWLGDSDLSHDVTFEADEATAELTIAASKFSLTPSTTGDLTATVVGAGIDGGSETVKIISTSGPPLTISYDMSEYTFAEDAADAAVYAVATLDAAYPRGPPPSPSFTVGFSSRIGTAENPGDYAAISWAGSFLQSDYERDVDTDPLVARKAVPDFAIVPDDIYEGSEHFAMNIERYPGTSLDLVQFANPDGTTCVRCAPEYTVNITDAGDLPVVSLSVDPSSIAEEDDDGTTSVSENVSTVTVEITNGKTFAVAKTVTLTFSGATQGTHYSVSPGDADPNTAGHQVLLVKETASVEVTVTATGNDTADGPRTVTVAAYLDGTAIGSRGITIRDDDTTTEALVSNTGQTFTTSALNVGTAGSNQWSMALGFTTGDNTGGYTLSSVEVGFREDFDENDEARVSIYGADASGNPESSLYDLDNPASITNGELNTFTARAYAYLIKETKYFVVVESAAAGQVFNLTATASDAEDAGKASGWAIDDRRHQRNSDSGSWSQGSTANKPRIAVNGTINEPRVPVTIEAQHESIGGGLEDLLFTLTRAGATTDALAAKVTITQERTWLGSSDLDHDVNFPADEATAELTIAASKFSLTPSTTGDLTATVVGAGIDGGSETVKIISTSGPPLTISYDMSEYTFAEDAADAAVYAVATLDAAYPRGPPPSPSFTVGFSSRIGTAENPGDYAAISWAGSFLQSDYERDVDTDPLVARKAVPDFAIVPDDIYEGSEHFAMNIERYPGTSLDLVQFANPDGTTCVRCTPEYTVNITDAGDLPVVSLSVDPSSIAEEDDDGTTSVSENVSTVTVEITNGKTFAVDQTVTLTFSGTATQGIHYSVSPGDADPNTAGHQVLLPKETASVEVTVTATGNDTADGPRTVTVAADLDGTAIGSSKDITILDDETTTTDTPVTIEVEHASIGAGLEDLVFTLTREGETTDALAVKVTIVQAQSWLGDSDLEHDVTFLAGSATAELTITASKFSFAPSTAGDLTATVSGDGIDGGSDTVAVISTSEPPITISYDMSDYTFAENSTDAAVYLVATLDAAYPREPSRNYFVTFSTTPGTAEDPEDYATLSERESFTRSEYGRDADADPFVARKLLSDFGFAIVDDAIYEGSERFGLIIEPDLTHVVGMAAFQKPDGTTCEPFGDCLNSPFQYPVTITDEGDLPELLLSAVPASIAEEDDGGTTGTVENVSTVTVEITNGKTFAVDQTVTLTFSGTATQGTHYSVNPGDADPNTAGHQVVLRTGDSSVEVTVTATGNDTADRNRTVTVAADLDGTAIGSTDITILDDETTNTDATGQPLITGTARVGGKLTATKNTIADTDGLPVQFPDDYTFEWVRVDTETPIGTDSNNYTVLSADAGSTIRVDVSFTDGAGYSEGPLASAETAVVVANNAPTLVTPIPDQSATIGAEFSYTFPATTFGDADNDPLTYTATKDDGTPLPTWLSFDHGTRTFSGTPPVSVVIPLPLKVTASDGYGGSVSDIFDINAITVPFAPTGLTATASGTTAINLSWTAPPNNGGSVITGYKIEVSSNGGTSWTDRVANTNSTSTTYAHTGLAPGTTRYYRVSAINSVGTGAVSNIDDATTDDAAPTVPGAPTSLTATASGTSTINLTWNEPSNDGGTSISGYKIEVSSNGGTSWTNRVANTGTAATTHSHTGLDAGTTRHYRVSAINSVGTGAVSNIDDATTDEAAPTVPGAPTSLTATASGTSTINLSWTAPADDGGTSISGYKIEVSSDGGTSWTELVAANTGTSYSHTGLSAGTTRHYRVSAINSAGTGAASSTANATTDEAAPTVPGAPTGLTATASGRTRIDLSWTAPSDNGGSAITGYKIEVSPNGDSNWTNRVANTGTTTTSYSHTGLSAGTTRHYRVSAINANGTGAASSTANATTDDDDQPGLAVVTVHRLATSVSGGGSPVSSCGAAAATWAGSRSATGTRSPTATTWSRGATSSRASR